MCIRDRYMGTSIIRKTTQKKDMWDLTHKFYEDNAMDKAFKYHLDDGLPGIDYGPGNNPARYKPHNIIAFPVFKGFGYDITYQKTNTLARFPGYAGWWSCLLYTSPSPRDLSTSRMPSSA
eukprot:TRINITY_DN29611_c0_g2_i1.p2 TRINITY_DN29611_c0_g2~~TRINITY_DN29611_c0_g2_i1.p2  ORF type:complete len:120 (-),score=21.56 TRINITY_DN29611_c0_g2_i1:104-463(-)